MNKWKMVLAGVVIALAGFSLVSGTPGIMMPYAMLAVAALVFVTGVMEFRKRKPVAFTLFLAAGFTLFVGVYTI